MPFTFSHPAIVLPATLLPKRTYSLTGLIIGSVTPDFEYFIRMKDYGRYGHTWSGIFWFDLPLGIVLAFIYHQIVRDSLLANLPTSIQVRLSPYSKFNWLKYFKSNWMLVILSLIIGSFSHLFWDSFTHSSGYFYNHIHILRHHLKIFGTSHELCDIGQHVSTILGALIIIIYISHLPKFEPVNPFPNPSYWIYILVISMLIFVLKIMTGLDYKSFYLTIVTLISCGLIALVATSFLFKLKFFSVNEEIV